MRLDALPSQDSVHVCEGGVASPANDGMDPIYSHLRTQSGCATRTLHTHRNTAINEDLISTTIPTLPESSGDATD